MLPDIKTMEQSAGSVNATSSWQIGHIAAGGKGQGRGETERDLSSRKTGGERIDAQEEDRLGFPLLRKSLSTLSEYVSMAREVGGRKDMGERGRRITLGRGGSEHSSRVTSPHGYSSGSTSPITPTSSRSYTSPQSTSPHGLSSSSDFSDGRGRSRRGEGVEEGQAGGVYTRKSKELRKREKHDAIRGVCRLMERHLSQRKNSGCVLFTLADVACWQQSEGGEACVIVRSKDTQDERGQEKGDGIERHWVPSSLLLHGFYTKYHYQLDCLLASGLAIARELEMRLSLPDSERLEAAEGEEAILLPLHDTEETENRAIMNSKESREYGGQRNTYVQQQESAENRDVSSPPPTSLAASSPQSAVQIPFPSPTLHASSLPSPHTTSPLQSPSMLPTTLLGRGRVSVHARRLREAADLGTSN